MDSLKTRIRNNFYRRKSSTTIPSAFSSPFSSFGRKGSRSNESWQHHHDSDPGDPGPDADTRLSLSAPPDIAAAAAVRLGQDHPPRSASVPATDPSPTTPSSTSSNSLPSSNDPFDPSPHDHDDPEHCAQPTQTASPANHSQVVAEISPEKSDSSSTPSLSSSRSSFIDAAAPQSEPIATPNAACSIDSDKLLVGSFNTTTTTSVPRELSPHPDTSHEPAVDLDSTLPSLPLTTGDKPAEPSSAMPPTTAAGGSSLNNSTQAALLNALLQMTQPNAGTNSVLAEVGPPVATRKIWVKRRGASATLITIPADAIVDDVRDMILRKYGNSLGRYFDSPDLNLHIIHRDKKQARPLGPEETLARTLDIYYPGGQDVDEALIIDVPVQRTPRPSPRAPNSQHSISYFPVDAGRPLEGGEGYFPPVVPVSSSLAPPVGMEQTSLSASSVPQGQPPAVPSPGSGRPRPTRERTDRPRAGRTHASSPTVQGGALPSANPALLEPDPSSATAPHPTSSAPSDPTPTTQVSSTPARSTSPRPTKKNSKSPVDPAADPVDKPKVPVPPISVLIVEDNPINLRLLQLFATKLKVRSQSCMNGRDAVNKWRSGGFHLVLMDIQLPVMNGLDATREIRRLERVNEIGVNVGGAPDEKGEMKEEDRLENREMFKSPVIIVALTASSLQSDRHEALAAGCNDFLTKPVSLKWLETKVREWGCMQALIDFDGWRQWKDFEEADKNKSAKKTTTTKSKSKKSHQTETAVAS